MGRAADADRIQPGMQLRARLAETAQKFGAQRGAVAQQFLAGFRVAEAIAAVEREIPFTHGQHLDHQNLAPGG